MVRLSYDDDTRLQYFSNVKSPGKTTVKEIFLKARHFCVTGYEETNQMKNKKHFYTSIFPVNWREKNRKVVDR